MRLGLWSVNGDRPTRVAEHGDFLEKNLEAWIYQDPSLVLEGLTWVGQQVVLPDQSRLDLLGLTREGQWVIAELKQGQVDIGTILQALHYAVFVATMPTEALLSRLKVDEKTLEQAGAAAEGTRSLLLMVVGTSQGPFLEDGMDFLKTHGFDIPIRAVTFSPFHLDDGTVVLARAIEERDSPRSPQNRYTMETVLALADERRVRELAQQFIAVADALGLKTKPWQQSFTIQSPVHFAKTLVYVRPQAGSLYVEYSVDNLTEAYSVTPEAVSELLGPNHVTLTTAGVATYTARLQDGIAALQTRVGEDVASEGVPD